MKKLAYIVALPLLVLGMTGCGSFVEGFDVSPNQPVEVTPGLLLSGAEVAMFSTFSGTVARTACSWNQQLNGTGFQSRDYSNYALYENDTDNDWSTIYQNTLQPLNRIIVDPTYSTGNPYYVGIAQVLKAMNLGVATDFWGDVPNSEALKGLDGEQYFNPKYDSQESVIADIQKLLTDAIANLDKPAADNVRLPGADDHIYGGDVSKWKKAAYALKARYAMRLSKKGAAAAADAALAALPNAMSASGDDMQAVFDAGAGPNQWNAFEAARSGYVRANAFLVDFMKGINDPRTSYYFAPINTAGDVAGALTGSEDTDASYVGSYMAGSATTPVPMLTYVECKFIEAEANFRKGNLAAAATAHNDAIKASVARVTGSAAPQTYIDAQASETDATISLEKIMTHKYVALYCQFESYSDWRRTNIPALTPNPEGVITSIPRRFPTPLNERANNTSANAVQDLTQKVWWDQ